MKTETIMRDSGADIAKDVRARVADLNEAIAAASAMGLDVELERVSTRTLGSPQDSFTLLVRVLQPL